MKSVGRQVECSYCRSVYAAVSKLRECPNCGGPLRRPRRR